MLTRRQALVGLTGLALAAPALPALAEGPRRLFFYELYTKGTELSQKALSLQGADVEIVGFMAPPLKAEVPFFVLTNEPMTTCPFCDEIAFWPDNIVYVTADQTLPIIPYDRQIRVAGKLDLGESEDKDTGFVSLVRLQHAQVTRS